MDWTETPAALARARAEEPVTFAGADGLLAGIFTPPASAGPAANRCVIFPARPRFGTRRLAVHAARALAAEGFAALRFDLRGHGESAGATVSVDRNQPPYGDDVAAAIGYLRETKFQCRFLLVGYCFDALSALDAFRSEADAIDGLFFAAAPVLVEPFTDLESVSSRIENRRGFSQRFGRSLRYPIKLISTVMPRLRRRKDPTEDARSRWCAQIPDSFESAFAALMQSRARALFLYGEDEPFYREFKLVERRLLADLDDAARRRVRIEVWPGAVHSLEREPAILDRVVSWAREFKPLTSNRSRHLSL